MATDRTLPGIHHITAMAGDPQRNLNFYVGILGQRLVKTTVNFDDPGTYHFYYGDAVGTPGTVLTFFPWPRARHGRRGAGEATAVAYTIPAEAVPYWRKRLAEVGMSTVTQHTRFGEDVLRFQDPDGMWLELVAQPAVPEIDHWQANPVPPDMALRGFHSTTLQVNAVEPSARLLTDALGFRLVGQEGNRTRLAAAGADLGRLVDLVEEPDGRRALLGVGSIHHVAFRTPDDASQVAWRDTLHTAGFGVTDVRDRQYFHSIYFRAPGGVLYEIATDTPGFLWDEQPDTLGQALKLPPWLEPRRAEIERQLPPIQPFRKETT